MTSFGDLDPQGFAAAFRSFLDWTHSQWASDRERNEVVQLVGDFLGPEAGTSSVVTRTLPPFHQVNLQTALDAWVSEEGRSARLHGVVVPPHHGEVGLQQLVTGEALPPIRLSAPPLIDLPNGPGSTLACLQSAILLVSDSAGDYVLLVAGPSEHNQELRVEIVGLAVEAAQAVHARLEELRNVLNVYRGHLLHVSTSDFGGLTIAFAETPATPRDAVILPEPVLARIERHALGVAEHRAALLAAGQHLKRGLLLFGPPGTGKTHTTRYLLGAMPGYTRLVLTGRALHAIGAITELARSLEPAVVVLEDVDLVAEDRSFGPGSSPVLFELLDAMDGAAGDADLLFLLTTNRADLLEPALAARPGRVDVAVEIDVPDAEARRRLLTLYSRSVPLRLSTVEEDEVVARTEGVTASYLKELLRRAVLEALRDDGELHVVDADAVRRALDDLLDAGQRVTRSLLGVGNDPEDFPGDGDFGGPPPMPRPAAMGWMSYGSYRGGRHFPH